MIMRLSQNGVFFRSVGILFGVVREAGIVKGIDLGLTLGFRNFFGITLRCNLFHNCERFSLKPAWRKRTYFLGNSFVCADRGNKPYHEELLSKNRLM